ncbi:MAG: CHAD domain-containing protein [Deferrisomatales bacterium]|nr:CHAD domain-containing protein [Deferrisomatales bacterium]
MPSAVTSLEYRLPADLPPAEVERRLGTGAGVSSTGTETRERVLLDTFDWRLYRQGTSAEAVGGAYPRFLWHRRADGQVLGQVPGAPPRYARDLPPGSLRRQLEERIEMRVLLPLARVRSRIAGFVVRDKQGKIVLRLRVEENTLVGETERPLRPRLHLEPVKGYRKALERTRRTLLEPLALEPAGDDLLDEALAALQVTPAAASPKVRVSLQPELPAGEASRRILLPLLETMEANEAGTIADLDSEFLHDFRVAVRRTRSALGQLKGVIPPTLLERFQEEFGWLGTITTPTRDMDVYLLNFPEYQASLPKKRREALAALRKFLQRRQKREHRALARRLGGSRYRTLKRDWRAFLEAETGADPPANAHLPVLELARRRIWKVYRRVLREGAVLDANCPAEQFHELRKTCKKLRYLLEFFQSLFPGDDVATLVKALKIIQDNLGVHNDLDVQAAALTGFGQEMQQEGNAPVACLMAMGKLVEDLERRQVATRAEFSPLFARFSTGKTRTLFRELFAATGKGDKKGPGR